MNSDEFMAWAAQMGIPHGHSTRWGKQTMPDGYQADWDYWSTGRDGSLCFWCGAEAVGVVLTDAGGPRCLTAMKVCGRHRPEDWPAALWDELVGTLEPGTVTLMRRAN